MADKQFALLEQNPSHPSLHFKKAGKVWSVRVTEDYRALAYKEAGDFVWFWIGSHEKYQRLLR